MLEQRHPTLLQDHYELRAPISILLQSLYPSWFSSHKEDALHNPHVRQQVLLSHRIWEAGLCVSQTEKLSTDWKGEPLSYRGLEFWSVQTEQKESVDAASTTEGSGRLGKRRNYTVLMNKAGPVWWGWRRRRCSCQSEGSKWEPSCLGKRIRLSNLEPFCRRQREHSWFVYLYFDHTEERRGCGVGWEGGTGFRYDCYL